MHALRKESGVTGHEGNRKGPVVSGKRHNCASDKETLEECWRAFLPPTRHVLAEVAEAMGPAHARLLAAAITEEIQHFADGWSPLRERSTLIDDVMSRGEELGWPCLSTEAFDIGEGLENWCDFCNRATLGELRMAKEQANMRRLALQGRERLASLQLP
jgi:hypothetical protein